MTYPLLTWLPVIALPLGALLLMPPSIPAWGAMWLLAINVFAGVKWLSWARVRKSVSRAADWRRHLAYFLAWPGLDAEAFLAPARDTSLTRQRRTASISGGGLSFACASGWYEERNPANSRPDLREWTLAILKTTAGAVLFWGVARLAYPLHPLAAAWVGMVGVGLMLHFGVLHLLSCVWRTRGVNARRLMSNPLAARSVSDYWGKRWNTAFRDLAHRFIFRPVSKRLGTTAALWSVFLFSGLVHDLVISVPAGGGYGLPTLFFLIQALAIEVEHSALGKHLGLARGIRGWVFTMLVLVVPVSLLFPLPFLRNIVLPMMDAMGAI
jgi:Membrane bound O-acyl transferase family